MSLWKLAGLLLVGGLQMQAWAGERPQGPTSAEQRSRCLENYAKAERELASRVTELESRKSKGYLLMGLSGGGYLVCLRKLWSVPGFVGCTVLFALPGGAGWSWNDLVQEELEKAQQAARIMSIYSSVKGSRDDADEVIAYLQDLRVDVRHEQFAKQNVIQSMENGSLCDEQGAPNVSYQNFLDRTRPGDT